MGVKARPLAERFHEKYVVQDDGCWIWTGTILNTGYGQIVAAGAKRWSPHRLSVVLSGREIPDGYDVHHVCNVRACVNPDHLEVLSRADHGATRRSTHCQRGLHEMTGDNVGIETTGLGYTSRYCRACRKVVQKHHNDKRYKRKAA